MAEAIVTQHQAVLDYSEMADPNSPAVRFTNYEPDIDPALLELHYMPKTLWSDMGEPEKITVTIVAGDTLNE